MPFDFIETAIPDVILIEPKVFGDERGFFMESYKRSDFEKAGIKDDFTQDNHSKSKKGVLRGLHYQKGEFAQGKIVRCPVGRIFDVAVDIRKTSTTFGKWVGYELSEENHRMLYIPKGFAHGLLVLSDEAEVLYKASGEYAPHADRGVAWDDAQIAIDWGFDSFAKDIVSPILSEKDKLHPFLAQIDKEDLF